MSFKVEQRGSGKTPSLFSENLPQAAAQTSRDKKLPATAKKLCTEKYQRTHFMRASCTKGRTGNRLFKLCTLLATAKQVCYTPVIRPRIKYLDGIFKFENVKRLILDDNSFQSLKEHSPGKYDTDMTSQILPAYNWTLLGYRISFKYFDHYAS